MEKSQINYVEAIVNHYHYLKGTIKYDELLALYNVVYPTEKVKLDIEDWIMCDIAVQNNLPIKVCERFDIIHNRIDISKSGSLQTSEIFMNHLIEKLQPYSEKVYGILEPFCDGIEQGLMLHLLNKQTDEDMYLWCSEDIHHNLVIVTSDERTKQNLCLQDKKEIAWHFPKENEEDALQYSLNQIDNFIDKDMSINI